MKKKPIIGGSFTAAAAAAADGEKHDESERIGGIVSRRAHGHYNGML